jgi:hypothetical protein
MNTKKLSLKERILDFVSIVSWKLFIWSTWNGNEDMYFNDVDRCYKMAGWTPPLDLK